MRERKPGKTGEPTENPEGPESEIIRDRLRDARGALKRRGQRVAGRPPFGYTADARTKQLVPDRAEARRVQAIFARAAQGETPRAIADHANRYGWRTKAMTSRSTGKSHGGNRWTPRQVLDTLANPTYVGQLRSGKKLVPGAHEPLVSRELFDQAAAQVAARRNSTGRRTASHSQWNPLRGILYCAQCQRLMSPDESHHGPIRYRYYRCRSHAGGRPPCENVSLSAGQIEKLTRDLIYDALAQDPTIGQAAAMQWRSLWDNERGPLLRRLIKRATYCRRSDDLVLDIVPDAAARVAEFVMQRSNPNH